MTKEKYSVDWPGFFNVRFAQLIDIAYNSLTF